MTHDQKKDGTHETGRSVFLLCWYFTMSGAEIQYVNTVVNRDGIFGTD